jgi:hypothetical protein
VPVSSAGGRKVNTHRQHHIEQPQRPGYRLRGTGPREGENQKGERTNGRSRTMSGFRVKRVS